jgi:penicillin V acylase-like amidase (Ntn superfamily)
MSYEHKIKVMTNQEQYDAQQEYNYFEMLVNTKEYVTKDEYEFHYCI